MNASVVKVAYIYYTIIMYLTLYYSVLFSKVTLISRRDSYFIYCGLHYHGYLRGLFIDSRRKSMSYWNIIFFLYTNKNFFVINYLKEVCEIHTEIFEPQLNQFCTLYLTYIILIPNYYKLYFEKFIIRKYCWYSENKNICPI